MRPSMTAPKTTTQRPDPGQVRLRIVFVDHVARLSGGEIALLRLLPTLSEHVHVTVILGEDGPLVDRLEQLNVTVEVLPLPSNLRDVRKDTVRPGGLSLTALAGLPRYVLALRSRIKELDADIVHTNSLKAALLGGIAARLARKPVVWHIRDRIASDYLPRPAVVLVRALCRVVPSAIIANSHATLATVPGRNGHVVYNSIEPPPPRPPVEPRAKVAIGMIGRLAEWKGQHVFLRAFAEAFPDTSVVARVIGSPLFGEEAYARTLHVLADELGIAGRVEFRGFQEDVWEELRNLDLLVHSSIRPEPFGQVILEGLAAGVPVVAADAGGPAELITDGVDGVLTPTGDVTALASALRTLVDDPELRRRLGDAGKNRSRDFTPERTVARLLDVYDRVLKRRSGTARLP
jgi:glycosyltransferase involved in cell wall biosynthesis